jgi:hypothetical protein
MREYTATEPKGELARRAQRVLGAYLHPLLERLAARMDIRLVRSLRLVVEGMLRAGGGTQALWKTALATELLGGNHTPAGGKRIDRLLRSPQWSAYDIDRCLAEQGEDLAAETDEVLIALDPSDLEKPESMAAEGLQRVASGTAKHLSRPRKGFGGRPLLRPVIVPGFHWVVATLMGLRGPAHLVAYRWWQKASDEAARTCCLLDLSHTLVLRYGPLVTLVGDRGVGICPLLLPWLDGQVRFVVRFTDHYLLCSAPDAVPQAAKEILKAKPAMTGCAVWDPKTRQTVTVRILWCPVWLPDSPYPLWLVIARHPHRAHAWRLLTNRPVYTKAQALRIVQIYARRWQVEWAIRFSKSELGLESIRLHVWEQRCKLMALGFLVYAFLIWLLVAHHPLVPAVLQAEAHRTGRRTRFALVPLYRLRQALHTLLTRHLILPGIAGVTR